MNHWSGRPRRAGLIALLAMMIGLVIAASPAQAATGYQDRASVMEGALEEPRDLALDPTTGNLLVSERRETVTVLGDPSGAATVLGRFSTTVVSEPTSIAVDPLSGDVYVAGFTAMGRWVSDGQTPPTYTEDTSFVKPDIGSEPGQVGTYEDALAVDPTTGDLLVADHQNHRINRYSPSGAFLGSFGGSGSSTLSNPIDLAVQPNGDIDILNFEGSTNFGAVEGTSRISRFTSGGNLIEAIDPSLTKAAVTVAFDPLTQDLLFARQVGYFKAGQAMLVTVHEGTISDEASYSRVRKNSILYGLAVGAGSRVFGLTGSLYSTYGEDSLQLFERTTVPLVHLNEPSGAGAEGVHVSGSVDPGGVETAYRFEYSADGGATWTPGPEGGAGSGQGATTVEENLAGLDANREYLIRLEVSNAKAERTTPTRAFRTLASPPVVVTGSVSEAATAEPELLGTVDAEGSQTQYFFEIGPTTAYGAHAPAVGVRVAGNGRTAVNVAVEVGGLNPGVLYHYRLVASNQAGTTYGEDRTLVAGDASEGMRAYEMVSPVEKGNVAAATYNESSSARADGDSMLFGSDKASYPGALATPYVPRNLAVRTSSGWVTRSLDPPSFSRTAGGADFFGVLAISKDQSRALVTSRYAFTPDAHGGEAYLYLFDIASGTYTLVSPIETGWPDFQSKQWLLGTAPDLSAIAFLTKLPLDAEAPVGMHEYLWREGSGLTLISREPGGTPFQSDSATISEFAHEQTPVSEDGSRVYFTIQGNQPGGGVYLWENGTTRAISVSHLPGGPAAPVSGGFLGASPDGRYAEFYAGENGEEVSLTSDTPAGTVNPAYVYDAVTGQLHYLAAGAYSEGGIAYPALGKVFFQRGPYELVYGDAGQTFVITDQSANINRRVQASDNGRYLVFEASGEVTGYDSGGKVEIYRFDSIAKKVICVSCRSDGGAVRGDAQIGQTDSGQTSLNHHFPQAVLDDGTVFFDTPDPLVGRDVNGVRDVYEYHEGQDHLISPGDSSSPATYLEATPDGRNVFFATDQRLAPQDTDVLGDVYDARVGGGFPAPSGEGEGCADRCRAPAAAPPSSTTPSEAVSGTQASRHGRRHKHRSCRKQSKSKKSGKGPVCHRHTSTKAAKDHHRGVK